MLLSIPSISYSDSIQDMATRLLLKENYVSWRILFDTFSYF